MRGLKLRRGEEYGQMRRLEMRFIAPRNRVEQIRKLKLRAPKTESEIHSSEGQRRADPEADIKGPQAEENGTADPEAETETPRAEGKQVVNPKSKNERYEAEESRRVHLEAEDRWLHAKTNGLKTEDAVPQDQRNSMGGLQTEEKPLGASADAKDPQPQSQKKPPDHEGGLKTGKETEREEELDRRESDNFLDQGNGELDRRSLLDESRVLDWKEKLSQKNAEKKKTDALEGETRFHQRILTN